MAFRMISPAKILHEPFFSIYRSQSYAANKVPSPEQVAREMHRADPSLATVLITGWEFSAGDPRLSVYDLRIQKPFDDIEEVVDAVAQAVALHDRRAEGKV